MSAIVGGPLPDGKALKRTKTGVRIKGDPNMKRCTRVVWGQALARAAVALLLGGTASAAEKVAKVAAKLDAPAVARLVDQEIQAKLDTEKTPAAPLADDAEFLRRLYLDVAGVLPPADKVTAFLNDQD